MLVDVDEQMMADNRDCMIIKAPPFVTLNHREVYAHTTFTKGVERLEFQTRPASYRCGDIAGRQTVDIGTGDVIESSPFSPEHWKEKKARKRIVDLKGTGGAAVYRGPRHLRTTCYYELLPDETGNTLRSGEWQRLAPGRGADGDAGVQMLHDQVSDYRPGA